MVRGVPGTTQILLLTPKLQGGALESGSHVVLAATHCCHAACNFILCLDADVLVGFSDLVAICVSASSLLMHTTTTVLTDLRNDRDQVTRELAIFLNLTRSILEASSMRI